MLNVIYEVKDDEDDLAVSNLVGEEIWITVNLVDITIKIWGDLIKRSVKEQNSAYVREKEIVFENKIIIGNKKEEEVKHYLMISQKEI